MSGIGGIMINQLQIKNRYENE